MCGIKGKRVHFGAQDLLFCTFRDISERLLQEERDRTIQTHLLQTNKMTSLGTMASGVAHEINNPNNYILTNAQMVADIWTDLSGLLSEQDCFDADSVVGGLTLDEATATIPKLLAGIIQGSRRINDIILRMKQFARPVQQQERQPVSLNRVVQFAVSMLERTISQKTERFSCHLAEGLPDILGFQEQLEQVVINLIHNALHALPDMNAAVRVTTVHNGDRVVLSVADEGVGIPDAVKTRIFEPFYTTKQDQGGTGLGLYISYGIVREHGGELTVLSCPGQGTTMTISLPRRGLEGGAT